MKTPHDRGVLGPTVVSPPSRKTRAAELIERPPESVQPGVNGIPDLRPSVPLGPTAIPGVERKRIAIELSDLRKLAPLAKASVLEQALRHVHAFVPERSSSRQTVLWGHRLQQDHSDLVSRTLELSRASVLDSATRHIARMSEILASIDIETLCEAGGAPGALGQIFRRANRKIDTPEELAAARTELDQLVGLMSEALEPLLALKEALEDHSRRIDGIGDELEASALAAQFLSAHLRDTRSDLSQRLLERCMSLTQTVAQIRGSSSARLVQIEHPLRLIGAIQDVALVMVPGWLGSIAALNTLRDGRRKLTPTEAGEIAHQLRNILRQLNP